jgi:hypothetical protein
LITATKLMMNAEITYISILKLRWNDLETNPNRNHTILINSGIIKSIPMSSRKNLYSNGQTVSVFDAADRHTVVIIFKVSDKVIRVIL